ncbi:MAG: DUF2497 domain-containing protein [Dongiaceae bacterium]
MEEILASIRRIISEEGPEPAGNGEVVASPAATAPQPVSPVAVAPRAEMPKAEPLNVQTLAVAPRPAVLDNDDDEEELVLTDVVADDRDLDSNVVPLKLEAKVEPAHEADPMDDDVELALDSAFSEPSQPTAPVKEPAWSPPKPRAPLGSEGNLVNPDKVASQLAAELPDLVAPAVAEATSASFAQLLQQRRQEEPVIERPAGDGLLVETLVRQAVEPLLRDWLDTHLEGIVERMVRREVERLARKAELG